MKKFFIGIDISKETFDVAVFKADDIENKAFYKYKNNKTGINAMLKDMKAYVASRGEKYITSEVQYCCENTGVYGLLICNTLLKRKANISMTHALEIKRSMGMQRTKTDKADAGIIAEYAMRFEDKLKPYEPKSKEIKQLMELISYRRNLVYQRTGLKVCTSEKSIDLESGNNITLIAKSTESIIEVINTAIKKVERTITQIICKNKELKENYDILTSIPGVGLVNAITLIISTDNFKKFDYNARKLCSYYGVAPFAHESGTSVQGTPHVSTLADRRLKSSISEAALVAIRHNSALREYYERCLAKGKNKYVVLNNVKNKLLHMAMTMVKNKTHFMADYESIHRRDSLTMKNTAGMP